MYSIAAARSFRHGENPARWRGHLDMLAARARMRKVNAALPYDELPAFIAALRTQDGVSARAPEFLILTAARTGEVIGASPGEIKVKVAPAPLFLGPVSQPSLSYRSCLDRVARIGVDACATFANRGSGACLTIGPDNQSARSRSSEWLQSPLAKDHLTPRGSL